MIKIVPSPTGAPSTGCSRPPAFATAPPTRARARSSDRVRAGGDAALRRYARRPRRPQRAPSRCRAVPGRPRPAPCRRPCAPPSSGRRAAIRKVARHRCRRGWRLQVGPGVSVEQRVMPLVARRLLRARRPLSAALVAADDGHPGPRRRRARGGRGLPAPRRRGVRRGARGRRRPPVPRGRRARHRGAWPTARARCRGWTRSSGPATAGWRPPSRWSSADCAIDFYAGPTEILIVAATGPASMDRRGPHRAGRARPRRAGRAGHARAGAWRSAVAREVARADARDGSRAPVAGRARRHHRVPRHGRGHGPGQPGRRRAPGGGHRGAGPARVERGRRVRRADGRRRWPATTPSARTTCCPPRAPRASAAASTPPIS